MFSIHPLKLYKQALAFNVLLTRKNKSSIIKQYQTELLKSLNYVAKYGHTWYLPEFAAINDCWHKIKLNPQL